MNAALDIDSDVLARALAAFGRRGQAEPLGSGLINRTFRVRTTTETGTDTGTETGETLVLQRINPIFSPAIHDNVRAVTEHLARLGLATPRVIATLDGRPAADLGAEGLWRLMTFVEGTTFDVVASPAQAEDAARLVGRVHAALDTLEHRFVGLRAGVHDTERHLQTLAEALDTHPDHRLAPAVHPLGRAILAAAAALPALPALGPRVCHGDLKLNNILFGGEIPPERDRALCLVDLDTVGPMSLAHELGDAWRSWCNPHGEDREDALFDLDIFAASLAGYLAGYGRPLGEDERLALCHGVEWVSLELAARFAADALRERYFGWDPARFPGRGEHNLVRARSQWSLHQAVLTTRPERMRLLGLDR